jgi:hypothetical protein
MRPGSGDFQRYAQGNCFNAGRGNNAQKVALFRFRRNPRILLAKGRLMPPSLKHAVESCFS